MIGGPETVEPSSNTSVVAEDFVRIAGFIAIAWRGRSDMRRHALRQHIYPLAADIGVAVTWELEAPESGVKRCANEKPQRYAEDLV